MIFSSNVYQIVRHCIYLQALSSNAACAILNIAVKETTTSTLQTLNKRLGDNIRADRQSVSVVAGDKVCISLGFAQRLPGISSVSTVVNIESISTKGSSNALAVVDEAATTIDERARFPWIVGSWTANNDLSALCDQCLASLDQVEGVSVDGCSNTVVC